MARRRVPRSPRSPERRSTGAGERLVEREVHGAAATERAEPEACSDLAEVGFSIASSDVRRGGLPGQRRRGPIAPTRAGRATVGADARRGGSRCRSDGPAPRDRGRSRATARPPSATGQGLCAGQSRLIGGRGRMGQRVRHELPHLVTGWTRRPVVVVPMLRAGPMARLEGPPIRSSAIRPSVGNEHHSAESEPIQRATGIRAIRGRRRCRTEPPAGEVDPPGSDPTGWSGLGPTRLVTPLLHNRLPALERRNCASTITGLTSRFHIVDDPTRPWRYGKRAC